jgi:hypothetical protein
VETQQGKTITRNIRKESTKEHIRREKEDKYGKEEQAKKYWNFMANRQ